MTKTWEGFFLLRFFVPFLTGKGQGVLDGQQGTKMGGTQKTTKSYTVRIDQMAREMEEAYPGLYL
jgi:hypothetical protein